MAMFLFPDRFDSPFWISIAGKTHTYLETQLYFALHLQLVWVCWRLGSKEKQTFTPYVMAAGLMINVMRMIGLIGCSFVVYRGIFIDIYWFCLWEVEHDGKAAKPWSIYLSNQSCNSGNISILNEQYQSQSQVLDTPVPEKICNMILWGLCNTLVINMLEHV